MGSFYEYSHFSRSAFFSVGDCTQATTHKQRPDTEENVRLHPEYLFKNLRACLKTAAVVFAVWFVE